jgi:large subunit ribosomal protein L21
MFAIVRISGKQYTVEQNSIIDVDKIDGEEGQTVTFTDVLLRSTDKTTDVGTPSVEKAKITATIVKQFQGEKIDVLRYKHKVRSRRRVGFRPQLTKLKVTAIA